MKNLLRASTLSILLCFGSVPQVRPSIKTKLATGVVLGSIAFIYGKSSYTMYRAYVLLRSREDYARSLMFWDHSGEQLICKAGEGTWCQFDENAAWNGGQQPIHVRAGGRPRAEARNREFDGFIRQVINEHGDILHNIERELALLSRLRFGLNLGRTAALGLRQYARYMHGKLMFYEGWLRYLKAAIQAKMTGTISHSHRRRRRSSENNNQYSRMHF